MLKRIYAVPLLCIASLSLFLPTSVSVPHIEPIPRSEPSEVLMRDPLAPYQPLAVSNPQNIITEEPTPPVEASKESQRTYLGEFIITGYCACSKCCGKWSGSEMSFPREDGTPFPLEGYTVAVDPGIIPLGTTLYIDGYGPRYAHDTGVKGNRIDIYFSSHDAACIGAESLRVWVASKNIEDLEEANHVHLRLRAHIHRGRNSYIYRASGRMPWESGI